MRICAGQFKSRHIVCPDGIRPTTDRVKQALFSSLALAFDGIEVLDLFSGSGALGLEALSRGAARAAFVDASTASLKAIRANIAALGITSHAEIIKADARAFIASDASQYDLIFMDPPYDKGLASQLAPHVYNRLKPGGILVIEHSPREVIPMAAWKSRVYGDTMITYILRT